MPPMILIAAGLLLGGIAVGMVVYLMVPSSSRSRQRLATLGASGGGSAEISDSPSGIRTDPVPFLTQTLQNTALWQELQLHLIRAGWMLRPSELVAICIGAGLVGTALGAMITKSIALGAIVGLVALAAPRIIMGSIQQTRMKTLSAQLPDALDMLAGSMRSGFSVLRAMQVVRSQMHPPIAQEFGRVVDEVQFGIPLEAALTNLVQRTGSYDLELVVAAIQTQLSVGGNLAEIFDSICDMIRKRVRLFGELSAATAEGKMSAGILLAMPLVMALAVNTMNPGYMAPLFSDPLGLMVLGVGVGLMIVGTLVIRKLIDVDV